MTAPTISGLDALLDAEPASEWVCIPGEPGCGAAGRWRGRLPCGCGGTVVACDQHQAIAVDGARLMASDGDPVDVCGSCGHPVPALVWLPL